jgi:transposase-like protein
MPQGILPIFPPHTTCINKVLSFDLIDDTVTYYTGFLPVFSHHKDDIQSFRLILAQFFINGCATQADLIRATGIPSITLKRAVKKYLTEGPKGFFTEPKRGGPRVLTPEVVLEVEKLLEEGLEENDIARELNLKADTLKKAISQGRIKKNYPSKHD